MDLAIGQLGSSHDLLIPGEAMDSREQPRVSVVTPVFNGEHHLSECIESVLRQTYQNWDYTIVDNCSTDRSLEVAERYPAAHSRIRVHSNRQFVGTIQSPYSAPRQNALHSKYCKV